MEEEIRYPVCPHRNVPAAFQRFLGPDSGGFERFFPDERTQRIDGTLLIVRLQSRNAVRGTVLAIEDLNSRLCGAWSLAVAACGGFASSCGRAAVLLLSRAAALLFGSRPARLTA